MTSLQNGRVLSGRVRQSKPEELGVRTAGKFNELLSENVETFLQHFGTELFPGSLNVDLQDAPAIHAELDAGRYPPAFVIPWAELKGKWNPERLGDGQAWRCELSGDKFPSPQPCWIFRRIKSGVPPTVIEILAEVSLSETYGLKDGDPVTVTLFEGPAQSGD